MRVSHRLAIWMALVLAIVSLDCAAQASRIVFSRSGTNSETLFRVNADGSGVVQLQPYTTGVYRGGAAWSPHGTYIAYTRATATATGSHGDIWLMTASGASPRRLTVGSADHFGAAWRPDGGMLAFIAQGSTGACLGVVRPDGTGQRNIFCPPGPAFIDYKPQWSLDGSRIFISTSHMGSGLEPPVYVDAYRVNAATGSATRLVSTVEYEHIRHFIFAPDGTHGLFASGWDETEIESVEFATGTFTPRATGYAPVYSHDGARFAYTKQGFTGAPSFMSYDHVWVMNSDGSGDHEVTPTILDHLEYVTDAWSNDDTRLLLDRTVYHPESPGSGTYVGTPAMRIFNVATSAFVTLPTGSGNSWYQSP